MTAYYNENNPFAAEMLRKLIEAGLIADGIVDERSIEDVCPEEIKGFTQCHFFAGVGVWSYALRLAGWPDNKQVWTGSCPCQPFSSAGQRSGFTDERHLWPAWFWLISQCRPDIVFGEQVASKDGRTWLDLVSDDMEAQSYAIGAAATVACGVGAPHKRQRIYWVAHPKLYGFNPWFSGDCGGQKSQRSQPRIVTDRRSIPSSMAQPSSQRLPLREQTELPAEVPIEQGGTAEQCGSSLDAGQRGPTNGFWRDVDWLACRDEKWRPVESGTFPLADGAPNRVGRLRAYGNAIVAQQAQAFIEAYQEITLTHS